MSTLTVKNIPPELYERLKEKAKANRRSLNNEIIVILERELGLRDQAEEIGRTRKIDEQTPGYKLVDEKTMEPTTPGTTALAKDWERPEENKAWTRLQPGKSAVNKTRSKKAKTKNYSLRGQPVIYHEPFTGVAVDDWEALK